MGAQSHHSPETPFPTEAGISQALLLRTGELKDQLATYAESGPFKREYDREFKAHFGKNKLFVLDDDLPGGGDYGDVIDFIDHFLLERRLADGRTLIDHFVEDHPEFPEPERQMLLRWQDSVIGLFEVLERRHEQVILYNLVDELTYHAYANAGYRSMRTMKRGMFLTTRLVPLGESWLFSGAQHLLASVSRREMYRQAAEFAMQFPAMAFRNPEKLEQGWETQRQQRQSFIAFFGTDQVVVPGSDLAEKMRAFRHFQVFEERDEDGKTGAERVREMYGETPAAPADDPLPELRSAASVGIFADDIDGIFCVANFAQLEEIFANPELMANRKFRHLMRDYLEDPEILPVVIRRLAERDPVRASRVFQQLLGRPEFDWERDGDVLLRERKPAYYAQPPLPLSIPFSDKQMRALTAPVGRSRPRRKGR